MKTKIEIAAAVVVALVIVALSFMYREAQVAQSTSTAAPRSRLKSFEPIPDCGAGIIDKDACPQAKKPMR